MLKALFIITIMAVSLGETENAYRDYLGYQTVEAGQVSGQQARRWRNPGLTGRQYLVMRPESKADVYLRFIEGAEPHYKPMRRVGWNATEILVKDPDALAMRLADSPFTVTDPPAFLSAKKNTRAFQAIGPNGELIYFTRIIDPEKSTLDLGAAKSEVGRPFIMVLGSPDISSSQAFFSGQLANPVLGPLPYKIAVLSRAYNLPEDTMHPLLLVDFADQFAVEVDQYPQEAKTLDDPRDAWRGGISLVTAVTPSLSTAKELNWLHQPETAPEAPYNGRRVAVLALPSGALLELVEGEQ